MRGNGADNNKDYANTTTASNCCFHHSKLLMGTYHWLNYHLNFLIWLTIEFNNSIVRLSTTQYNGKFNLKFSHYNCNLLPPGEIIVILQHMCNSYKQNNKIVIFIVHCYAYDTYSNLIQSATSMYLTTVSTDCHLHYDLLPWCFAKCSDYTV